MRLSSIVRNLGQKCASYRIGSEEWKYIASGPAIDNDAEAGYWLLGGDGGTEKTPTQQGGLICCEPERVEMIGCRREGAVPQAGAELYFQPPPPFGRLDGDGHVLPCLGILRLDAEN